MEMNEDIYPNADHVARARSDFDDNSNEDMKKVRQKPEKSESRRWRLSVVCRVLLCAPLLVAALLLCLKFTGHIKTSECDQLQMRYDNLTVERDQLQMRYDNLTVERVQLQKERNDLKEWISNLTQNFPDGWVYFGSSLYRVSIEKKNWDQSREDCKMRGANLVIVNSAMEQDFVKKFHKPSDSLDRIWIGLSDSEEEGTWKWVDGSPLGSWSYWGNSQPNGKENENCVAVINIDWHDQHCLSQCRWICEKRIELK